MVDSKVKTAVRSLCAVSFYVSVETFGPLPPIKNESTPDSVLLESSHRQPGDSSRPFDGIDLKRACPSVEVDIFEAGSGGCCDRFFILLLATWRRRISATALLSSTLPSAGVDVQIMLVINYQGICLAVTEVWSQLAYKIHRNTVESILPLKPAVLRYFS